MAAVRKTYGPLDCVVFPPSGGVAPRACVILCHGYGAPGTDLVPLGFDLVAHRGPPRDQVQLVFPAAPLSLDEIGLYGGRAWWPINMQELLDCYAHGDFDLLREQVPPGLDAAREAFLETLAAVQEETQLPLSRIVLGGFSQGAMLTTDTALHLPESPAGLCILSGTLICESRWRSLAPRHRGLPVLQSHGRADQILPVQAARELRDLLTSSGLEVDYVEFPGPHTIPPEALERVGAMIDRVASL